MTIEELLAEVKALQAQAIDEARATAETTHYYRLMGTERAYQKVIDLIEVTDKPKARRKK